MKLILLLFNNFMYLSKRNGKCIQEQCWQVSYWGWNAHLLARFRTAASCKSPQVVLGIHWINNRFSSTRIVGKHQPPGELSFHRPDSESTLKYGLLIRLYQIAACVNAFRNQLFFYQPSEKCTAAQPLTKGSRGGIAFIQLMSIKRPITCSPPVSQDLSIWRILSVRHDGTLSTFLERVRVWL